MLENRKCCGRPAFSQGNLDEAQQLGAHNLSLLKKSETPILFLEPSCYSMFAEDYREMKLDASAVAQRSFLFERFVENILEREPDALPFKNRAGRVALHAHCHVKSLMKSDFMKQLAQRIPGKEVQLFDTGCCGMAGAFGALESKYDLSVQVAEPLVRQIEAQPNETIIVASGTSCRHQIEHLTSAKPKHMAELLADALV